MAICQSVNHIADVSAQNQGKCEAEDAAVTVLADFIKDKKCRQDTDNHKKRPLPSRLRSKKTERRPFVEKKMQIEKGGDTDSIPQLHQAQDPVFGKLIENDNQRSDNQPPNGADAAVS